MEIYEYGQVDPLDVLHLNMLCLGFALTPELAETIYREEPRVFPFFSVYASVDGVVAGQVGVFRLPVVSTEGADEVGGVWAVSTHPAYRQQGIAHSLLEEAHERMRAAGLRFSTLGTDRFRVASRLYEKLGYEHVFSSPSVIARRDALPNGQRLTAEVAGRQRLPLADRLFEQIASGNLGFARRHTPFFPLLERRGALSEENLWLVFSGGEAVGYVVVYAAGSVMRVPALLMFDDVDPVAAVAAVARKIGNPYVKVTLDRLSDMTAFTEAGLKASGQDWGTFMVKPLAAGSTVGEFRRLYGLDDGRFLISYLDIT